MTKEVRTIRVEGDIAYVPLTRGYEALIDVEDINLVADYNWRAIIRGHTVYARRNEPKTKKAIYLHRAIIFAPKGFQVDHKDRNGLNNRKRNLRIVTQSENQMNREGFKNNKSGFKGVFWCASQSKWRSRIQIYGEKIHLGYFDCPRKAHEAYKAASIKYHGQFCSFDPIPPGAQFTRNSE